MSPSFSRRRIAGAILLVLAFGSAYSQRAAPPGATGSTPGQPDPTPSTLVPSNLPAPDATPPSPALVAPPEAPAAPSADPNVVPNPPGIASSSEITSDQVVHLPEYLVQGRQDDMTGIATSATQGVIGNDELSYRPLLRPGEILEAIPGVVITQHAGGGKANQYFTRGFNLDHGTDFGLDVDGLQLNLVSHAHGQGYADINPVIPELIDRLAYEKGPYFPANGDNSTVGFAHLIYADTLPSPILKIEGGTFDYQRVVLAGSAPVDSGNLLYGFETAHNNGPWVVPDEYNSFNGTLKYSQGDLKEGFSVMAMAYHGTWNSTDQVAESAVASGEIPFYGSQSPTDGGYSQRYSLQGEWHQDDADGKTQVMAYYFHYDLNLFSNFDYYYDYQQGDQFEQQDNRNVGGLNVSKTWSGEFLGRQMQNTLGFQNRDSWIDLGLYRTLDRVRIDKTDWFGDGYIYPATIQVDTVTELNTGFFWDNKIQWADKIRTEIGAREDVDYVKVDDLDPVNSGQRSASLLSPKANLIFGPWDKTEFYLEGGSGFHSNDARAVTATTNPIVPENNPLVPGNSSSSPDVGSRLPLLVQAYGAEVGLRTTAIDHLQSTVSLWYLHNNSELYFDGVDADDGQTTAILDPTRRYGIEWSNYYTPFKGITADFDFADSWAYFENPASVAQNVDNYGGTLVNEAIHLSFSGGVTYSDPTDSWDATLRVRYFGPRPLVSDGSITSRSTQLVNLGLGWNLNRRWRLTCDVLNLLNRKDHDIDYVYASANTPAEGAAVAKLIAAGGTPTDEDHFHPVEPFELRIGLLLKL
jgi:outer membrane cobalamin receptor